MYLQSINSDKHLPQSSFTSQFFFVFWYILLWCLHSYYIHRFKDIFTCSVGLEDSYTKEDGDQNQVGHEVNNAYLGWYQVPFPVQIHIDKVQ
jgi:hypothetical protein